MKWAEQLEKYLFVCVALTCGLGKEIHAEFGMQFLDCQGFFWENGCPGKLDTMTDLSKTIKDIQDVNHILQRHFTMSKQGMLDTLPLFFKSSTFLFPFQTQDSGPRGLMRSLLYFLTDMSPPERTGKNVDFMRQMAFS